MSNLLPLNASPQERALEDATARLADLPPSVRSMWTPDTCPAALLPWMAWAFSVDEWDAGWTDAQKRGSIKASLSVHKHKGTVGAVKEAMAGLGFTAELQEWHQTTPAGTPYTFGVTINVDQTGFTQQQIVKLIRTVLATKNLRSHLTSVQPILRSNAGPYLAGVLSMGVELDLNNFVGAT